MTAQCPVKNVTESWSCSQHGQASIFPKPAVSTISDGLEKASESPAGPVIRQYLLTVLRAAQRFGRGKALLSAVRDKEAALAGLR